MQPQNYVLGGTVDPGAAFTAGLQNGQAQQMALMQQQQALAQQQQQAQVLQRLATNPNPTAQDYARATLILPPAMREQVQQSWTMRNTDQQQGLLQHTGQVFAALQSGQAPMAAKLLRDRAGLIKATDPQEAQALESMAQIADAHPELARSFVGMQLASVPGGDKVITNLASMGTEARNSAQAPAALRKAEADANTAEATAAVKGVEAGNATTATTLENQTKAEAIRTAQLKRDIDRLDIQIKGADSETRRGELQLQRDKLQADLDQKQQARAQQGQADMEAASTALQTVDSVLKHPGMTGFFYGPGTVGGKMAGFIPGTDSKDFRALVDTLKSQSFLTQIEKMRGMGQLTEIEGKKITDAVANLDTDQSQGQLKAQLGVVRNTLQKAQSRLTATGVAPSSGPGAYVMQHPKFGAITEPMINDMMRRTPGATREQVLNFMQATGGK